MFSSFPFLHRFSDFLDEIKKEGRYRHFLPLKYDRDSFPKAFLPGVGEINIWCSCDSMSMARRDIVVESATKLVSERGAGSGGTRNIAGTHDCVETLETLLASIHEKERAVSFVCGYLANSTSLRAIGQILNNPVFISDEMNHASMIDGMKGFEKVIYPHCDMLFLRRACQEIDSNRPKVIAFETLYSMSGDFSPVHDIVKIAEEFGALTYADEAHAVGLYGPEGAGHISELGLSSKVDCIQGSLSKAVGSLGGYIASSEIIADAVRCHGSGFIFTSSLPQYVNAASVESLLWLKNNLFTRESYFKFVKEVRQKVVAAGFATSYSRSHIIPIMVPGGAENCSAVSERLLKEHGIYVTPINFPTVARGKEQLRIVPNIRHSHADLDYLISSLQESFAYVRVSNSAVDLEFDSYGV